MPAAVIVDHDNSYIRGLATNALRAARYEVTAFDSPMAVLDAMDSPTRIRVMVTRVDFRAGQAQWRSAGPHGQAPAAGGEHCVCRPGAEP